MLESVYQDRSVVTKISQIVLRDKIRTNLEPLNSLNSYRIKKTNYTYSMYMISFVSTWRRNLVKNMIHVSILALNL
jgi:hypothetical protein